MPLGLYARIMASNARHPQLNAMLVCERVIREEEAGLVSLIGILDAIRAQQLPVTVPLIFVSPR